MVSQLTQLQAALSPQRLVAGLVFIPLLAYSFPPFREMDLPFSLRLVFWTGVVLLAVIATWVSKTLLQQRLGRVEWPFSDLAYTVLILSLFTPALWVLAWLLYAACGQKAPGLMSVGVYGVLFSTGLLLIRRNERGEVVRKAQPRLLKRLSPSFEGEIYRLTVRDHYVDVVTSEGVLTIRSRFTDAIDSMEPVPGHCTHRSHWVVDDAIVGSERKDGKIFLRLKNDDLVPVSRKYKPQLEEDGFV